MTARVVSVNTSEETGTKKVNVNECILVENKGLEGDAHAGHYHRQVSLLALESIGKMREAGLEVGPGDFGENLTTEGLELVTLPVGSRLKVGSEVVLEVSQIGKECETPCSIYYTVGDCVMPREGIFAVVVNAGPVKVGDPITVLHRGDNRS